MKGRREVLVKQTLYFPEPVLAQLMAEAARQERSVSWLLARAWERGREAVMALAAPPSR